jgi:hypothetical protein
MTRLLILLSPLLLLGCGVETVGTAAIVAAEKKQEIEQAQQLKQAVQQQLDAAALAEQQRLKAMEAAAAGQ